MDVIRELQKQLKAAQKGSNVKKISERNCVDLIQKLVQDEWVKLFHTSSGKEWLTPEQLDHEVRDALSRAGGRLNVADLPGEVGVAVEHCEARVELLRKQDASLTKLGGELISAQYLQGVAQEVEESLEEAGCLAVADVAGRYNLPADFVRDSVLTLVGGSAPSHVVRQNTIFTGAHAARVEARARGAVRGCTRPATLAELASRHALDADLLATAVQKLIKAGTVQGKLQGSTFTPKAYSDAQASRIKGFFDSNAYLTASMAKGAGVTLKEWAKAEKAQGLELGSAFVASQLVDSVLSSIADAVSSESFLDVQPLLPPALTSADAADLLQQLGSKKKLPPSAVVMDRVVMSRKLIEKVAASLDSQVKEEAEKALKAPAAAKATKKAAPKEEEDDDWDDGAKKKKGKKPARGKKGKAEDDDEDGPAGGGGGGDSGIDNQVVCDLLAETYPELPPEVHGEVCDQVQPLLAAAVLRAQAAMRSSLQSSQKAKFEQAEKLVQQRYEALALGLRALEATGMQDSPLQQHLLREVLTEPLHMLISMRLEEATGADTAVTAANRKQCLDKLASKEGAAKVESLNKLLGIVSKGKDAKEVKDAPDAKSSKGKKIDKKRRDDDEEDDDSKPAKGKKKRKDGDDEDDGDAREPDAADALQAAADDCHIFCRKVDKKREKAAMQEQRAEGREKLKELASADAVEVCHLGLQLSLLSEGVPAPAALFPAEGWAMRLVAERLRDDELQEQALALCACIEQRAEGEDVDSVDFEAKVAAWKARALAAK